MKLESINKQHHLGIRPLCSCCGGGEHRKGYTLTKAKSHKKTLKAKRSKPKSKDWRFAK